MHGLFSAVTQMLSALVNGFFSLVLELVAGPPRVDRRERHGFVLQVSDVIHCNTAIAAKRHLITRFFVCLQSVDLIRKVTNSDPHFFSCCFPESTERKLFLSPCLITAPKNEKLLKIALPPEWLSGERNSTAMQFIVTGLTTLKVIL